MRLSMGKSRPDLPIPSTFVVCAEILEISGFQDLPKPSFFFFMVCAEIVEASFSKILTRSSQTLDFFVCAEILDGPRQDVPRPSIFVACVKIWRYKYWKNLDDISPKPPFFVCRPVLRGIGSEIRPRCMQWGFRGLVRWSE